MSDTIISPDLAKTIAKVRGLLNLSAGTKNENEMKAAATAADKLMQEHRITHAMLEAQGSVQQEPMVALVVSKGGRRTAWREVLLGALALQYGCAFYVTSYRSGGAGGRGGGEGAKGHQKYTVCGQKSDTEIVAYMFDHLEGEIERLCRWHTGGKGVKFAGAWLVGCASGISKQFSDMREAARQETQVVAASESTCAVLVLLDKRAEASAEYMKEIGITGKASAISGAQDWRARAEGYEVGKKVQIRQGLPASTTTTAKLGA